MSHEPQQDASDSSLSESATPKSKPDDEFTGSDFLPSADTDSDSITPIIPDDRPTLPCISGQDVPSLKNVEPPLAERTLTQGDSARGPRATDPDWRPSTHEHRIEPPAEADEVETYGLSNQPPPNTTPTVFGVASGGEAYSVGNLPTSAPPTPQAKMCPACGAAMSDRMHCTSCGWRRRSARASPPPSTLGVVFSPITDRVIPSTFRMYFVLGTYISAIVLVGLLLADSVGGTIDAWLHSFSAHDVWALDVPAVAWPAESTSTILIGGFGLFAGLAFLNQFVASSMRVCAESAGTELRADISDAKPLAIFTANLLVVLVLLALVNVPFAATKQIPAQVLDDISACLQAASIGEASAAINNATTAWLQSGIGASLWFLANVCMLVVAPTIAVFSIAAAAIDGKAWRGPAWFWHCLSETWSLVILLAIVAAHGTALWVVNREFHESAWLATVLLIVGFAAMQHVNATLWALVGQALHRQRKVIRWKGSHSARLTECPACGTSITGVGTTCRECGANMSLETGRGPLAQTGWFASRVTQFIGVVWCCYLASSLLWNPERTAMDVARELMKSIRAAIPF